MGKKPGSLTPRTPDTHTCSGPKRSQLTKPPLQNSRTLARHLRDLGRAGDRAQRQPLWMRKEKDVLLKNQFPVGKIVCFPGMEWRAALSGWNLRNFRLTERESGKSRETVKKAVCRHCSQAGQINRQGEPFPWPSHLFLSWIVSPRFL